MAVLAFAIALPLPAAARAQDGAPVDTTASGTIITAIAVERTGDRVRVRFSLSGPAGPALSELLRSRGRDRILLTLPGASIAPDVVFDGSLNSAGVLGLDGRDQDHGARFAIDAPTIGAYGFEPADGAVALWFEPQPVLPAITPPMPTSVRSAAAEATRREAAAPAVLSGAARAIAFTRMALEKGRAAVIARIRPVLEQFPDRTTALLGIALVLGPGLLLILAVRLARSRRARVRTAAGLTVPGGLAPDGRIWAARTFATQGFDEVAIARRTGLAREAVHLLLRSANGTKLPDPAGIAGGRASRTPARARA